MMGEKDTESEGYGQLRTRFVGKVMNLRQNIQCMVIHFIHSMGECRGNRGLVCRGYHFHWWLN